MPAFSATLVTVVFMAVFLYSPEVALFIILLALLSSIVWFTAYAIFQHLRLK